MRISWKHIVMGSFWSLWMGFCGVFSLGFSPIQLITQKSECLVYYSFATEVSNYHHRILLACIKYLGAHPCPRCLVKKCKISAVGTVHDRRTRMQCQRQDDQRRCRKVELVRWWMYEGGKNITSVHIDRVLGPQSLTPTRVSVDS
jgi:hypothetical protein